MERISNDDIKWLLELLKEEGLAEIEVEVGDSEVCVRAQAQAIQAAAPAAVCAPVCRPVCAPVVCPEPELPENVEAVLSPMAGIFYHASAPENPPFVEVGDFLQIGDTIGLIEAMKLFNEVTTHIPGRVVGILVENEQQVEADQPLFLVERSHQ